MVKLKFCARSHRSMWVTQASNPRPSDSRAQTITIHSTRQMMAAEENLWDACQRREVDMERRQPLDVTSIDDPVRSAGQKWKSTGQNRNRQPRADEGQSLDSPLPGAVARDMSEDRVSGSWLQHRPKEL